MLPRRQKFKLKNHSLSALTTHQKQDNKPSFVFLHGLPSSAELWRPVLYHLAKEGYHTLALDLPGCGQTTSHTKEHATFNQALNLIQKWIEQQSLDQVWWVGHHIGASLAIQAAKHLASITARVTINSPPLETFWPTKALALLEKCIDLGILETCAKYKLVPNFIIRHSIHKSFHQIKKLDNYTEKKVFWNEKIHYPLRLQEFSELIKSSLALYESKQLMGTDKLNCPLQLIDSHSGQQNYSEQSEQIEGIRQIAPSLEVNITRCKSAFMPLELPKIFTNTLLSWTEDNNKQEAQQENNESSHPNPKPLGSLHSA